MSVGRVNSAGLRRDLELLEVLGGAEARRRGGLGVVRIAALTGREKTQVSRALGTLADSGLVERDDQTLSYRLGWRLYVLAAQTFQSHLVEVATPFLRRLVSRVQETAHLCVLRGEDVLTLATEVQSVHALGMTWKDVPLPAVATSPGRVLLSEWAAEDVRARFTQARLKAASVRRRFHTAEELLVELGDIRARGYAVVDEEFEPGVVGCSAPVRDVTGAIVAAVNLEAPKTRLGDKLEAAGRFTARVAADLSVALGAAPRPAPGGAGRARRRDT